MASTKKNEFKDMSVEQLKEKLTSMEIELVDNEFDHAAMGLEDPLSLRKKRRNIARVKTLIRQHEIAEMTPEMLAKRSKKVQRRRKKR